MIEHAQMTRTIALAVDMLRRTDPMNAREREGLARQLEQAVAGELW